MSDRPWVSGPHELLHHGLHLLKDDSDLNRRLALIAIDNAVELIIRTFLSLPRRVTGVGLSRKGYEDIADSFPKLLDALEQHAGQRIDGIDLGDIEWYHRLRNQLYHQGSGLTVEREKVEVYASVATLLFKNLFGVEIGAPRTPDTDRIGRFLAAWVQIERALQDAAAPELRGGLVLLFPLHVGQQLPPIVDNPAAISELNRLRELRNEVVHQGVVPDHSQVQAVERWAQDLNRRSAGSQPNGAVAPDGPVRSCRRGARVIRKRSALQLNGGKPYGKPTMEHSRRDH